MWTCIHPHRIPYADLLLLSFPELGGGGEASVMLWLVFMHVINPPTLISVKCGEVEKQSLLECIPLSISIHPIPAIWTLTLGRSSGSYISTSTVHWQPANPGSWQSFQRSCSSQPRLKSWRLAILFIGPTTGRPANSCRARFLQSLQGVTGSLLFVRSFWPVSQNTSL